MVRNDSSIIAFRTPIFEFYWLYDQRCSFRFTSIQVKENPEIVENSYVKINVESYGGMLMAQMTSIDSAERCWQDNRKKW